MDQHSKQALIESLKNKVKKASSNVSTKVEATKGDHKVVISSSSIDYLYKDKIVNSIKVASLDDDTIDLINSDADEASVEILDSFIESFGSSQNAEKTAAHSTQDDKTWDMVTQKQLDEQKVSLHPRWESHPNVVTQKQLPDAGQRPGTYNVTTEGQFRDEVSTFYNEPLDAGKRRLEDRNTITETQFDHGTKEYSEVGESDRHDMGSVFDGDVDAQWRMIGEKQLEELLKHHEWTEPFTTTEGKDQLGQQDGELGRLTASDAKSITEGALTDLAKTVLAAGVTPDKLSSVVKQLVSHPSKYKVLADTIAKYQPSNIEAIDAKVAKAQYFGKVANTKDDWSDFVVADVFIRQISKKANTALNENRKITANDLVKCILAMSQDDTLSAKINDKIDTVLSSTNDVVNSDDVDVFKQALSGQNTTKEANEKNSDDSTPHRIAGSADDDGLYQYTGLFEEVKANVSDRKAFMKEAADVAKREVLSAVDNSEIDLIPLSIDVDSDAQMFKIKLQDSNFASDDNLTARAEKRRKMANSISKEAQFGGGGGMPPTGGGEMGNPAPPMGGADMGADPATESLAQPEPMDDLEDDGGNGEPQPPGSICGVCGTNDVDVDNGEFRCNNCGSEGKIHINMEYTKWPETIQETEEGGDEGFGLGAEEDAIEGDLIEEGSGTTMPNVPIAASVKITPYVLEKISEQKIQIGSVCPNCGGHNTNLDKAANRKGSHGICWDCMQEYRFQVKAAKGQKHKVYAQFAWLPKTSQNDASCSSCTRLKSAFVKSLENYGMNWKKFDDLTMAEKARVVVKMANTNSLNIEKALNAPLPIGKYASSARWSGSERFDKFPKASCMERIARRFGENATAMSGPCQGKALADCVCSQLQDLGIYTDGLAAKVASTITSKDSMEHSPMETCVEMLMANKKDKFTIKEACIACDGLRAAYASVEDLIIETIAQHMPGSPAPVMPRDMATRQPKPMSMDTGPGMAQPGGAEMSQPMDMSTPKPMGMDTDIPSPMDLEVGSGDMGGMEEMGTDDMVTDDMGMDSLDSEMNPLDVPVTDIDDGLDLGIEGETITISLPQEVIDAVKVLFDALQGHVDDQFVDDTEDVDVSDITEDTVDDGVEEDEVSILEDEEYSSEGGDDEISIDDDDGDDDGGNGGGDFSEDDDEGESIPGLSDESDDDIVKESNPMESKQDTEGDKPMKSEHSCPHCGKSMQDKSASSCPECNKTHIKEASSNELDFMLTKMKKGTISNQSNALDSLIDGLVSQGAINKEAAKTSADIKKVERTSVSESKIKETPAQNTEGIGTIQNKSSIGHEKPFTDGVANSPDVPRAAATIGEEGSEVTVNDKSDRPTVPNGSSPMEGEEHYKSEKGNQVDGNQGGGIGTSASNSKQIKTASEGCDCPSSCSCNQNGSCDGSCGCKTASKKKDMKYMKDEDKNMCKDMKKEDGSKECGTVSHTIKPTNKVYAQLTERIANGKDTVKLSDKKTYQMITYAENILLIPVKNADTKKESQTVTPNKVDSLADDPDINNSSGPGAGKTHVDKSHSLGVDEKKPSEGVSDPSVPEAPNGGRLAREHTVEKATEGPEIPAGGGMNSEYDQNDKNEPEKLDKMLGKQNDIAAMAEVRERATKIAGRMLKADLISIDDFPNKVEELSKASSQTLEDYEQMLKSASAKKGLQKEASGIESPVVTSKSNATDDKENDLASSIQGMFRLDQRNKDFERFSKQEGNNRLFR